MHATTLGRLALALSLMIGLAAVPQVARADQNEATAVAIWFVEADGSTKPYYFHDLADPMPRWSCVARLDYLTKKFFRMSRSNPILKGKKAVRSACVAVRSIK